MVWLPKYEVCFLLILLWTVIIPSFTSMVSCTLLSWLHFKQNQSNNGVSHSNQIDMWLTLRVGFGNFNWAKRISPFQGWGSKAIFQWGIKIKNKNNRNYRGGCNITVFFFNFFSLLPTKGFHSEMKTGFYFSCFLACQMYRGEG